MDWGDSSSYYGSDYSAYGGDDFYSGDDFYDGGSYEYSMPSYDWLSPYTVPEPTYFPDYAQTPWSQGDFGYTSGFSQGPLGIPQPAGSMNVTAPSGQGGGLLDQLLKPQTLLGLGGAVSGLIGTLAGGGQGATQSFQPTTAQKANMTAGNQWAQMGVQGQLPSQQQQMSLLNAIASGQGLAQPYAQAVERAFEPQLGSLYDQAVRAGRARGFHDAPAQSPAGGAILGPGLSDLQGQMARAKLEMMMGLPGLYNQPVATQGGFAQNYLRGAQSAPMSQTTTQPLGPQLGQQIGGALSGVGQVFAQSEAQQKQDQQFRSLLDALRGQREPSMV